MFRFGGVLGLLAANQQQSHREQMRELRLRSRRAARKRSRGRLKDRVVKLEKEVDELKLYLATLLRYNMNKGKLDIAEFKEFVDAIDESDGERDGTYDGDIA
jgi:hypothetical protein